MKFVLNGTRIKKTIFKLKNQRLQRYLLVINGRQSSMQTGVIRLPESNEFPRLESIMNLETIITV